MPTPSHSPIGLTGGNYEDLLTRGETTTKGTLWKPVSELTTIQALTARIVALESASAPSSDLDVLFTEIASTTIDEDIDTFWTIGRSFAGVGYTLMRRVGSEPSHAGKKQSADGAWWEISPYQQINIEQFGADTTATGSDNLTAIQNCVAFCSAYGIPTYLPQGSFTVSGSILYDAGNHFIGMGKASRITGNFAGYIFNRSDNNGTTPLCNTVFRSFAIENTNGAGSGIWVARGIGFKIENCDIRTRLYGAYVDYQALNITFDTCTIVHQQQNQASGSIGILSHHHTAIINCDITHWETAIRKWNQSGLILGGRLEVNKIGVMLGRETGNNPEWARGTLVSGVAFEACDTALVIRQGEGITVTGCVVQGTAGSPSGGSIVGFDLQQANGCSLTGNSITGEFSTATVRALAAWDGTIFAGNYLTNTGGGVVYSDGGHVHTNSFTQFNSGILNSYGSAQSIATGNKPAQSSTDGNDTTPVTTETYLCVITVPQPTIVNGIAILIGSAVAGSATLCLYNRAGAPITATKTASTTLVGVPINAYKRIPFTAQMVLQPGEYYVAAQFNDTGARFRTHTFGNFGCEKITGGTYGTFVNSTDGIDFNANVGPIASLY